MQLCVCALLAAFLALSDAQSSFQAPEIVPGAFANNKNHFDQDRTGLTPSKKLNLCNEADAIRNGTLLLKDGLRGKRVSSVILPSVMTWDYKSTGGDPLTAEWNGGHMLQLMDEISRRAGFEWKLDMVVSSGPMIHKGESATQFVEYWLDRYDIINQWYVENADRKQRKIAFPYNWFDASSVLFTKHKRVADTTLVDKLFSFIKVFSGELWAVIIGATIVSAFVYWLLERDQGNWDYPPSDVARGWGLGLFMAASNLATTGQFEPTTWFGRIYSISWGFTTLLLISAYTANLASYLVISGKESFGVNSMEDAVKMKAGICSFEGTAVVESAKKQFPTMNVVRTNSWTAGMYGVRDGLCTAGIATASQWDLLSVGEANNQCDLSYVGRPFKSGRGGWVVRSEFSDDKCSQVMADCLGFHFTQMDEEGLLDLMWQRRLMKESTNNCSRVDLENPDDTGGGSRLPLDSMGGLFLVHAVISALLLIARYTVDFCGHCSAAKEAGAEGDGGGGGGEEGLGMRPQSLDWQNRSGEWRPHHAAMDGPTTRKTTTMLLHKVLQELQALQHNVSDVQKDVTAVKKVANIHVETLNRTKSDDAPASTKGDEMPTCTNDHAAAPASKDQHEAASTMRHRSSTPAHMVLSALLPESNFSHRGSSVEAVASERQNWISVMPSFLTSPDGVNGNRTRSSQVDPAPVDNYSQVFC